MTNSSSKTRRTHVISRRTACVLVAFSLGGGAAQATIPDRASAGTSNPALPAGLKQLLDKFKAMSGLSADFKEEKHIALLAAPLYSSGTVYFHPPHSLARIVTQPQASHLVLTGKRIVVKDKDGRHEVDMSDKPALQGLINSLLHVLSGNEESLVSAYKIHFVDAGKGTWSLTLTPKSRSVRGMIKSFTLAGEALKLSELRVKEASGDETITRFSNVNEKRQFTRDEIRRLFEI